MYGKKDIVILAAGGGNDILSAISYVKAHISKYEYSDIAIIGMLGFTPFHTDTDTNDIDDINVVDIEKPIIIPSSSLRRYLMMKSPKEINCTERLIPNLVQDICPNITHYACLSSKYSALEQACNLDILLQEWNYMYENTLIEVVDFGGDILTDGNQSSIISPCLDAFTLAIAQNMSNKYLVKISVCFPGVDGELEPDYLYDVCARAQHKYEIDPLHWHNTLQKIYDKIENTRPGNTIPNMIAVTKCLIDNDNICQCSLTKKWVVNSTTYSVNKSIKLDIDLQRYIYTFYIFDHNPYVSIFNDPEYDLIKVLEHIRDIYSRQTIDNTTFQSCDLFLQYLCMDSEGKWTNKHLIKDQKVMLVDIKPTIIADRIQSIDTISDKYDLLYSSL